MIDPKQPDLVTRLGGLCLDAVAKTAVKEAPYALLDFPFYANIGDSAIWSGSRKLLEQYHGAPPAYVSTKMDFDAAALDAALPEGPIYIKGGGNFGDLYPAHHRFRFEIVKRYGSRVIHLPQSLHFDDEQVFEDSKELARLGSHLMVRDHPSFALGEQLGFEPILVPDAAFCLGLQERAREPDRDLLVLKRTDKEDIGNAVSGVDWGAEAPLTWLYAAVRATLRDRRMSKLAALDYLADMRVKRGLDLLSHGRAVATDRLHGHIMTLMLGIPHFVSDNSTGKLGAFVDAWSSGSPLVHKLSDLSTLTRSQVRSIFHEVSA